MIPLHKVILLAAIICLLSTSCDRKKDVGRVKITISINGGAGQKAKIYSPNHWTFGEIALASSDLDSTGEAILEFKLDNPIFASIQVGERYAPFYLTPGDEIQVSMNANGNNSDVKYSGDGSEIHSYLSKFHKISDKYENLDGIHPINLEEKPFLARRDSLQKAYTELLNNLLAKTKISKETETVLRTKSQLSLIFFQQNWVIAHYGIGDGNADIPVQIKQAISDIPFDLVSLKANMYEYATVLQFVLLDKIYPSINDDIDNDKSDSLVTLFPITADQKIKYSNYPQPAKEILRGKNISYYLQMNGITPEFKTVYNEFKKDVKDTSLLSGIEDQYRKWAKIERGQQAPDFTAISPADKEVSLSSLKGKVVYMDVWATWCGPCKEEFPDSKKLINDFKGNDQVAFLFFSIDQNIADWRTMVAGKTVPNGIHVNQKQTGKAGELGEAYLISGIPRYVLIDKTGKIVQTNAVRPSSGKVQGLINDLLKNENKLASK